jgi:hypothetical protein
MYFENLDSIKLISSRNVIDLLDHCTFRIDFDVPIVYSLCTWAITFLLMKIVTYKKEKKKELMSSKGRELPAYSLQQMQHSCKLF